MWLTAALHLLAVAATLLITWRISINCFDVREKASNILGKLISAYYISCLLSFPFIRHILITPPPFLLFQPLITLIGSEPNSKQVKYGTTRLSHGVGRMFDRSEIRGSLFLSALSAKTPAEPKCSSSIVCPADRFALHITSGAADVVGPKICFEGKTCALVTIENGSNTDEETVKLNLVVFIDSIMSHVLNNVGPGLNTVVINGQ